VEKRTPVSTSVDGYKPRVLLRDPTSTALQPVEAVDEEHASGYVKVRLQNEPGPDHNEPEEWNFP
jgi:hypothetical protein